MTKISTCVLAGAVVFGLAAGWVPAVHAETASATDKAVSFKRESEHLSQNKRAMPADLNHDGVVTKDEFVTNAVSRTEKHFQELDEDGNGTVTKAESTAAVTKRAQEKFAKKDVNKDGKITTEDRAVWQQKPWREKKSDNVTAKATE